MNWQYNPTFVGSPNWATSVNFASVQNLGVLGEMRV